MESEKKIRWLDTCRECDKQKPLQKNKRCNIWYAINTDSPMAEASMRAAEDPLTVCKYFEPKAVK